jgi:hypothetical protein
VEPFVLVYSRVEEPEKVLTKRIRYITVNATAGEIQMISGDPSKSESVKLDRVCWFHICFDRYPGGGPK